MQEEHGFPCGQAVADAKLALTWRQSLGLGGPSARVLAAGAVGQFVEFYDFAIYGFSVVIIAQKFFPQTDPVVGILAALAVYGVAFVVRPLGGLFFGSIGDRLGRRTVLYVTLLTIGIASAAIGVLPTYAQAGLLGPILLLLCRLVQGFSAGGEAVGAPAFVLEHAPVNHRALWVGITVAMSAVPSIVAGVFILALAAWLQPGQYAAWGWRIPFLIAAPLSLIGLYIRSRTEESEAFVRSVAAGSAKRRTPMRESFTSINRKKMLQVFLVVSLNALTFYLLVGYLVTYMQTVIKLSQQAALLTNAVGLLCFSLLLPAAGHVSDRVGRKPMLIAGSLILALASIPVFYILGGYGVFGALVAQIVLAIGLAVYGGGSYTFFVELFPTSIRLTGAAIAYNTSYALFGGAGPFVAGYLVKATGDPASPGWYLAALASVAFLAALTFPETAGCGLSDDVDGSGALNH